MSVLRPNFGRSEHSGACLRAAIDAISLDRRQRDHACLAAGSAIAE
jgi:hypothetical protein